IEQYYSNQVLNPDFRGVRILDIGDMLTCMAGLTFFIGVYRLHGHWFSLLPADARQRRGPADKPPRVRSEASMSPAEFVPLLFTIPILALLVEFTCLFFKVRWSA